MKQRRRKFISIVMMVTMIFTMIPSVSFATGGHVHSYDANGGCTCGAHGGSLGTNHTSWTQLSQSDFTNGSYYHRTSPTTAYVLDKGVASGDSKSFYLTEDITADADVLIGMTSKCTINLCLNGHTFKISHSYSDIYVNHEACLNVFDCNSGNELHYFTKSSADSLFDTYNRNYDISGKTEGVDYITVLGGAFINSNRVFSVYNGTGNVYGTTVIGCSDNDANLFCADAEDGETFLSLNGTKFRENSMEDGRSIILAEEDDAHLLVKDVEIFNNRAGSCILVEDKTVAKIQDSRIVDNTVTQCAVGCYCDEDVDFTLKGDVVIKDNLKDGLQKNLVCVTDKTYLFRPFVLDNLTSPNGSIGLSNFYVSVPMESKVLVDKNDGSSYKAFFSDDSTYCIENLNNKIWMVNRLKEQPNAENGYTCNFNSTGLQSTSYKWYRGDVDTTLLDENNTDKVFGEYKGSCDAGIWTPHDSGDDMFEYFSKELSAGSVLRVDLDFGASTLNEGIAFGCCTQDYEFGVGGLFTQSREFAYQPEEDATYGLWGCFGNEPSTTPLPKLKNARVETFTPTAEVAGQTTNKLTEGDVGYYVCKITMTDKDGVVREVSSCPVKVTEKITPQPSYNPTTPDEPTVAVKKPKSTTVKPGKKSFKITIKKPSGQNVSGYQIRYCLKKNMKKAKFKNISSRKSKTTVTIKKLKPKKTYYVQVRTIKKKNGNTYRSSWTKIKKIRTK